MTEEDKFCLKWNDFQDNIVRAHRDLRSDRDFHDVSLVCGGETFKAHRVILAACSPAFREMIRESPHHHPVLYLRGVKKSDVAALLDFMYHGEASLPEDDLEDFLSTAEDLKVRGLVLGEDAGENGQEGRSRRVSGENLATALDDDVASLLAGLDGPDSSQAGPPPSKRVKQERHEAGRQLASLNNLSVSSATSNMSRDELATRIRVKQEAREQQQQQEENVNSVEAAKRKLANLTNSISLGKPAQSSPTSFQLPASGEQITPRNQEILKQLMVTNSGSNKPAAQGAPPQQQQQQQLQQQNAPQPLNIGSLAQGAILRHIQQNNHSQQQQQHTPQSQQHQHAQAVQQQSGSVMTASPQLQQLVRMHAPPPSAVAVQHQGLQAVQHPSMTRVQMQVQGTNSPGSPPVLHIPEGFNQGFNNQVVTSYANSVQTTSNPPQASPLANDTAEEFAAEEDPEYQRQVEAYIERIQTAEGPKLQCRACQKITHAKSKATMVNHVEATHIQATVACNYCNKTFKARSYLKNHLKKCGPAN